MARRERLRAPTSEYRDEEGNTLVLRGVLILFLPPDVITGLVGTLHVDEYFYAYAAIPLILGAYLCLRGFTATPAPAAPPPPSDEEKVKLLAKLDDLQLLPPPGKDEDGHVDDVKPATSEKKEPAASLTRKLEDQ